MPRFFWHPVRARARWLELSAEGALAELKSERSAAVASTRAVPGSPWAYQPRPFSEEIAGAAVEPARPVDSELGLDADGRTVLQRRTDDGWVSQLYSWGEDWCEIISLNASGKSLHLFNFVDGQLVEEIEVDGGLRLDGRPGVSVTRWTYDGEGRPVLTVTTYESGNHPSFGGEARGAHWRAQLRRLFYDEHGTLEQIMWARSEEGVADGDDADVAQAAAVAGEETLFLASDTLYESVALRVARERREAEALQLEALHEGKPPTSDQLIRKYGVAGFRLIDAPRGKARPAAILHGPGLLPPGADWPRSGRGRALAFLAAIDFSAVPPTPDGSPALPSAGWLLCFADTDDPTGYDPSRWNEPQPEPDGWEPGQWYGEPTLNTTGSDAQVLWVPPGVDPVPAAGPGLRGRFPAREQRRVASPQMTLPDGFGAGKAVGLSTNHSEVYAAVASELRFGFVGSSRPDDAEWLPDDWILGAVTGVQGEPPGDDSLLLFHFASVDFQDGGAIQVRIPADALASQDWSQISMSADSG